MNINEQPGKFTAPAELRFVRSLPGPIERVWEYITDPEKRARWFCGGILEQKAGGKVEKNVVRQAIYLGGMCAECEGRGTTSDLDLAEIIMKDCARIQSQDAERKTRKAAQRDLPPDAPPLRALFFARLCGAGLEKKLELVREPAPQAACAFFRDHVGHAEAYGVLHRPVQPDHVGLDLDFQTLLGLGHIRGEEARAALRGWPVRSLYPVKLGTVTTFVHSGRRLAYREFGDRPAHGVDHVRGQALLRPVGTAERI